MSTPQFFVIFQTDRFRCFLSSSTLINKIKNFIYMQHQNIDIFHFLNKSLTKVTYSPLSLIKIVNKKDVDITA